MAVMVARARVDERLTSTVAAALLLVAVGAATGAGVLGLAALAGSAFPAVSRSLVSTTLAAVVVVAIVVGRAPWQWDHETPTSWLDYEDWRVAVWNGAALGAGFVTRIGFWLWWALPLFVFSVASPRVGILAGLVYGGTRLGLGSGRSLLPDTAPVVFGNRGILNKRRLVPILDALCAAVVGALLVLELRKVVPMG